MHDKANQAPERARGFLTRLARDVRGNALMIMAAALIPMMGMVGGGIDISRMYIVKTRLQHACDAGALAGRKSMGGGTWAQSSYKPRTEAERFFDANIASDAYGATAVRRSFSEKAGKVVGTASADLPMTLMRIFGKTTEVLSVTCDAEMRLPNTDIMFVLDTTGSMASNIPGESTSKIAALRTSVKCFFEIVARLDTNATCEGGNPSGGTGDQVQIRFGFVPYSTNVNVGRLLPTAWLADEWSYQSRKMVPRIEYDWTETRRTSVPVNDSRKVDKSYCTLKNAQDLLNVPEKTTESGSTRTVTRTDVTNVTYNDRTGYCSGTITTLTIYQQRTQREVFDHWTYAKVPLPLNGWTRADGTRVQGLKKSDGTFIGEGDDFLLRIGADGSEIPVRWEGCIEERQTTPTTDFDPIPTDAYDLDLASTPVSGDTKLLWGPALPSVIFQRQARNSGRTNLNTSSTNTNYWSYAPFDSPDNNVTNNPNYFCPSKARNLDSYPDTLAAQDFENYVDNLKVTGNTYHDIGLLWGARLIWPTGIFRDRNEFTDRGGEIDRHIIFMTDGETNALPYDYTAYGVPWFDRRQTSENTAPSAAQLNDQVNLRFSALCTAIKNNPKGITLWVINFGNEVSSTTKTRLSNCATSPDYFFDAADSDELQKAFRKIADDISQLRLTK